MAGPELEGLSEEPPEWGKPWNGRALRFGDFDLAARNTALFDISEEVPIEEGCGHVEPGGEDERLDVAPPLDHRAADVRAHAPGEEPRQREKAVRHRVVALPDHF